MAVEGNAGRAWLTSLARFGIRPGLLRTEKVLEALGNPHESLCFFHVAGTNGKGSVCAYLARILGKRLKVGVFTSPAFDGYRGRMVVGDSPISAQDFNRLALTVRDAAARVTADDPLTEFEALTVMAILHFAEQCVEAVVWETGLGGRFDSTNVVLPVVSAITNVGLDHMQVLGPTVRHIARDKAGIIKPGRPVVTASRDDALLVIREIAAAQNAELYGFQTNFGVVRRHTEEGYVLDYRGQWYDWYSLPLALHGAHQAENAAVALAMYEVALLGGKAPLLPVNELRDAMASVYWPGRFEVIEYTPGPIVLDGAHNPDGARRLNQALREFASDRGFQTSKWTFVTGVLGDKDYHGILRALLPLARRVYTVAPHSPRALSANDLMVAVQSISPNVEVESASSLDDALVKARLQGEPVCCFGSLYTVDEARKAILCMED